MKTPPLKRFAVALGYCAFLAMPCAVHAVDYDPAERALSGCIADAVVRDPLLINDRYTNELLQSCRGKIDALFSLCANQKPPPNMEKEHKKACRSIVETTIKDGLHNAVLINSRYQR